MEDTAPHTPSLNGLHENSTRESAHTSTSSEHTLTSPEHIPDISRSIHQISDAILETSNHPTSPNTTAHHEDSQPLEIASQPIRCTEPSTTKEMPTSQQGTIRPKDKKS